MIVNDSWWQPIPDSWSEGMIEKAGGRRAGSSREKALIPLVADPTHHPPTISIIPTDQEPGTS